MLISNSLKKLLKNALKVISKTSFINMSKSEKSEYFWYVFAFLVHFFKTFSTDLKSAWNSALFDTYIEFYNKNFVLALFSIFL